MNKTSGTSKHSADRLIRGIQPLNDKIANETFAGGAWSKIQELAG